MRSRKLPLSFFRRNDVVRISRELIGMRIFTKIAPPGCGTSNDRRITGGIIVETEAYAGLKDRASHAFGNRRTKRTEIMFRSGGVAYVYLCYGIHSLFNIVTNIRGVPDAVLIRAVEPIRGVEVMLRRRNKSELDNSLAAGPGSLARALGIGLRHSGTSIAGNEIWLEPGISVGADRIISGPRVGVQYAGEDASRPWRFRMAGNVWTSRAK